MILNTTLTYQLIGWLCKCILCVDVLEMRITHVKKVYFYQRVIVRLWHAIEQQSLCTGTTIWQSVSYVIW